MDGIASFNGQKWVEFNIDNFMLGSPVVETMWPL